MANDAAGVLAVFPAAVGVFAVFIGAIRMVTSIFSGEISFELSTLFC